MQIYRMAAFAVASSLALPALANAQAVEKPYNNTTPANYIEFYPGAGLNSDQNINKGIGAKKPSVGDALSLGHGGYTLNARFFQGIPKKDKKGQEPESHRPPVIQCFVNAYDQNTGKDLPDVWVIETDGSSNRPETIRAYFSNRDSPDPKDPSHWTAFEGGRTKSVLDGLDSAYIPWFLPSDVKTAKWVKVEDAYSRLTLTGPAGFDQSGVSFTQMCEENLSKSGFTNKNYASLELIVGEMKYDLMR